MPQCLSTSFSGNMSCFLAKFSYDQLTYFGRKWGVLTVNDVRLLVLKNRLPTSKRLKNIIIRLIINIFAKNLEICNW